MSTSVKEPNIKLACCMASYLIRKMNQPINGRGISKDAWITQACDEKIVSNILSDSYGIFCADYRKNCEKIPSPFIYLQIKVEDACNSVEDLWYDRDIDDFTFPVPAETRKKHNKNKVSNEDLSRRPGIQYPIDLWFLIGQHIKPENVKTFAAICKGSYFVSRTYSFWLKMYKRYYTSDAKLPQRLQPDCIEGSLCLKVNIIRALYHMYPHFTTQLSHKSTDDVYALSNLCCTSVWRVQQNGKWLFYFKFKMPSQMEITPISYQMVIQNMWSKPEEDEKSSEEYVNHNPDQGYKVLQILSSHFVIVSPFVMGSRLSDVRINLAHDMRRQKLQLTFCHSSYRQYNTTKSSSKENGVYGDLIEFDPVENINILNWWHPQYPSSCKI